MYNINRHFRISLAIILFASCSAFRQIGYEKIGRFQVFLASCLTSISFYKPFDIFNEGI